jgi:hypothetical protein
MPFQVFDGDKPCDEVGVPRLKGLGWVTSRFATFAEALKHARKWCAPYGSSYDGEEGFVLEVNKPYDYSGYGDMITIKEVV